MLMIMYDLNSDDDDDDETFGSNIFIAWIEEAV